MIETSASAMLLIATNLYVDMISSEDHVARSLVAIGNTTFCCDMRSLPRKGSISWTYHTVISGERMADNFFLSIKALLTSCPRSWVREMWGHIPLGMALEPWCLVILRGTRQSSMPPVLAVVSRRTLKKT